MHDEWLRGWAAAVDDAGKHLTGHRLSLGATHRGQLQPLALGERAFGFVDGVASVVALPGAGQKHIARFALSGCHGEDAPAVGHVVPHQAAAGFGIDGLVDDEGRHITRLAIRIFGQLNVLNDGVVRQLGVELSKSAAG